MENYIQSIRAKVGQRLLIMPGFRIVLENQHGEILLMKRSDFKVWGLLGGSPNPEERMEDCIRREVKEEGSLELHDFACFGFASHPPAQVITYPNGDPIHGFDLLVYSRSFSGVPRSSDGEALDLRFFAPSALPPQEAMLEGEYKTVQAYFEYLRTNEFQWI